MTALTIPQAQPPQQQRQQPAHTRRPRIITYHQTHFHEGKLISILPLLTHHTAITHVILAAIHLNDPAGSIHLNDDPYDSPKLQPVWTEIRTLQRSGIKVLGMLGGAAKGSFARLDGPSRASFDAFYQPLRRMVAWSGLDGLDLDVEEDMSLAGIIRLIDALHTDFGPAFLITLAPVAPALQRGRHLSGFDYVALEKAMGEHIAWYNVQFYCGWGSVEDTAGYDNIVAHGWPADKIVLGMTTNPESCEGWVEDELLREVLVFLIMRHPGFGGVMGWEYFGGFTASEPFGWPWSWANLMTDCLVPGHKRRMELLEGGEEETALS